MAKKRKRAKKPAVSNAKAVKRAKTAKKASKPKKPTPKQLHARVVSLLGGKVLTGEAAAAFSRHMLAANAPAAAAVAKKPVSFTCTNFGCLVNITADDVHFVFSGTGGANFRVGQNDLFFAVQGPPNQSFTITAQGGTLDFPINSNLTAQGKAGGMRTLTVA
ncbi:MAG TPA: hypothetical protein VLJ39_21955 [Tepidisphaeraceae bacterium]|nr:hypothetical protein [Tepidisphaeraceae bacterium]